MLIAKLLQRPGPTETSRNPWVRNGVGGPHLGLSADLDRHLIAPDKQAFCILCGEKQGGPVLKGPLERFQYAVL